MPRPKTEREVTDDPRAGTGWTVKEIEAAAGGGGTDKVTARYVVPSDSKAFQEMILGLSDSPDKGAYVKFVFGEDRQDQNESPLAFAYRMWCSTIDKVARQMVYENVAAESTLITVGGEKKDIMEFPVSRLVRAINRYRDDREMKLELAGIAPGTENAPENADKVKVVDKSVGFGPWRTAARKLVDAGKAKENSASGMLEAVEAA